MIKHCYQNQFRGWKGLISCYRLGSTVLGGQGKDSRRNLEQKPRKEATCWLSRGHNILSLFLTLAFRISVYTVRSDHTDPLHPLQFPPRPSWHTPSLLPVSLFSLFDNPLSACVWCHPLEHGKCTSDHITHKEWFPPTPATLHSQQLLAVARGGLEMSYFICTGSWKSNSAGPSCELHPSVKTMDSRNSPFPELSKEREINMIHALKRCVFSSSSTRISDIKFRGLEGKGPGSLEWSGMTMMRIVL